MSGNISRLSFTKSMSWDQKEEQPQRSLAVEEADDALIGGGSKIKSRPAEELKGTEQPFRAAFQQAG